MMKLLHADMTALHIQCCLLIFTRWQPHGVNVPCTAQHRLTDKSLQKHIIPYRTLSNNINIQLQYDFRGIQLTKQSKLIDNTGVV